jgi:hypothetical protein
VYFFPAEKLNLMIYRIFLPYPTPPPTGLIAPSDVGITATAALPPISSSQKSSSTPGAIAGIVVGSLLALLVFVGACFLFIRRRAIRSSQRNSEANCSSEQNSEVIEPDRKIVFTPSQGELPRRPESTHSSMYYPEMELNEMGKVLVR